MVCEYDDMGCYMIIVCEMYCFVGGGWLLDLFGMCEL